MSYLSDSARLLLGLACLISALVAPPWLPMVFATMLALRYRAWEIVGIGLFMDLVWLPHQAGFGAIPFATILTLLLVIIFEPLRRELLPA